MRKISLSFFLVFFCVVLKGQNLHDAYRASHKSYNGTARFNAMNGAFTALGGDLSALNINPASGAVFTGTTGALTMGWDNFNNDANYYGTSTNSSDSYFNVNQAGAVFVFKSQKEEGLWRASSFGFNYNRTNNFNNEIAYSGNNTTIPGYVVDDNGNPVEPIYSSILESFRINADRFYFDGMIDQAEGLAQQVGAIEFIQTGTEPLPGGGEAAVGFFVPNGKALRLQQSGSLAQEGYSGEWNFSFGGNIGDFLYLGIGYQHITYETIYDIYLDETGYVEDPTLLNNGVESFYYERYLTTTGEGGAWSFGAIARIGEMMRLGISYKTGARMNMQDEFANAVGAQYFNGVVNQAQDEFLGVVEYDLRTPAEFRFGAATIFGLNGLISVDYMYKDYSSAEFRPEFEFDLANFNISEQMKASHNINIGGEFRLNKLRIRGGYGWNQSPYEDVQVEIQDGFENFVTVEKKQGTSDIHNFSLGLGYNFGVARLDMAYSMSSYTYYEYLYEAYLVDPIATDIRNGRFVLTLNVTL